MDTKIIEVVIPLTFFFLLLSFVCSAAIELMELFLKRRAIYLEKGIHELSGKNSGEFVALLYRHGLISSLYRGIYGSTPPRLLPSYIPAHSFALALIDFKNRGIELPPSVQEALHALELLAGPDVGLLQRLIEGWYNATMDRVSGWFKRRTQLIVLVLGIAAAVAANADCIDIVRRLSVEANFRETVTRMVETAAKNSSAPANRDQLESDLRNLENVALPLGWPHPSPGPVAMLRTHWSGWLLTALIVSIVAPLWFDLLNRIMVVRSTIKPYETPWTEGPMSTVPVAAPAKVEPAKDSGSEMVENS